MDSDKETVSWMRRFCNVFVHAAVISGPAINCAVAGAIVDHRNTLQQLARELGTAKEDLRRLEIKSREIAAKEATRHERELSRVRAALDRSVDEVAHLKQLRELDCKERDVQETRHEGELKRLLSLVDELEKRERINQSKRNDEVNERRRALETATIQISELKEMGNRDRVDMNTVSAYYDDHFQNLRLQHEKEIQQRARAHQEQIQAKHPKPELHELPDAPTRLSQGNQSPCNEAVLFSIDLSSSVGSDYSAMIALYKRIVSAINIRNPSAKIAVICHSQEEGPVPMKVLQPFESITTGTEILLDQIPLGTSYERHDAVIVEAKTMIDRIPPRYECRMIMLRDNGFFLSHDYIYAELAADFIPIYVVQFESSGIDKDFGSRPRRVVQYSRGGTPTLYHMDWEDMGRDPETLGREARDRVSHPPSFYLLLQWFPLRLPSVLTRLKLPRCQSPTKGLQSS
ncbi:hypothetical protein BCR34DRAFT_609004 [Clohesyomyces aquaticus]|uniref:VWFA domain-containing protein n=1 Tax=Clohesyomyces aquaticus TaxID=1231657 RepID=A0A1Y1Y071_9PLEO|nr:hypothetical protein BCR34DRAFT_609004 [Clohesyomyces aquaticus]